MPPTATEFVPPDLDATRWENVEPLFRALAHRPLASAADYERWLLDRSELDAACSEARATLYIAMTRRTDDPAAQTAYAGFIQNVQPKLAPASFEVDRKQAEQARRTPLPAERYAVLERDVRAEVELFRPENVPLETELALLSQKYDQIVGAMTVQFEGQEQTLARMARYQELSDRPLRERAWRTVAERRLLDADAISAIFDEMIALRDRVGRNAGFENYVGYAFKAKHRFDYSVAECRAFHEGVERHIVPLMRKLDAARRSRLGVSQLRPWDLATDVLARPPLRPFEGGRELFEKSVRAFASLDARLAAMLEALGPPEGGECLDLDSRKGKAPIGYQYMRDRSRRPFIFMNAAGLARDVVTMLHEAGHAFHSALCVDEPLLAYRGSPIEFAEVASMSMELLALPHLGGPRGFYPAEPDRQRHARQQIERSLTILPWIATIDAFQHWLYEHPEHTRAEREACWLALDARFGNAVSWEGIEDVRRLAWQRQSHLFGSPFYYIEYGIAQLGALLLWLHSLERGERSAIDAYLRGLRLGGSKPLPELFAAAGLAFDFGPGAIARVAGRAERELAKLPE